MQKNRNGWQELLKCTTVARVVHILVFPGITIHANFWNLVLDVVANLQIVLPYFVVHLVMIVDTLQTGPIMYGQKSIRTIYHDGCHLIVAKMLGTHQ